ncbi:MAG TPA: GntR family transcriptional regulator [Clostridiaceae bacterium]|nr:GntR family transcriptional regulator [Clostridiaceae bacterium]
MYESKYKSADNINSLREWVFTKIEDDILSGRYKPGDDLVETKLSKELGVSRTPIREALRKLELEGLVEYFPNKGVVVKGLSSQDIEDIYTIRMLIEGLAARWATEKITQKELDEMEEAIQLEEFYTMKNDINNLMRLDSRLHDIIYKASKSRPLMKTLSTYHNYLKRARSTSFNTPGRALKALEEHRAIFEAIKSGDAESAEKLTIKHVKNASLNLLKQKKEEGNE